MKKNLTLLVFAFVFGLVSQAQNDLILLDATTTGTTITTDSVSGTLTLQDDNSQGTSGNPMYGRDYFITIVGSCEGENRLVFYLNDFSVSCIDTLYFYDGADTNAPLITKINNFYGGHQQGDYIFISPTNNTNTVTVRFRTGDITNPNLNGLDCYQNNGGVGHGFSMAVSCRKPCEKVTPVIEDKFYRTRNGVVYDSGYVRMVTRVDTVWVDDEDHTQGIDRFDTLRFLGAHLCIGDGVIFKGHGEYTYNYGYYTPSDATSLFTWDMANEGDTIQGVGMTSAEYTHYQKTGCYDMVLDIVDVYGCGTDMRTSIKVRTSANPIKTIFTLSDICNSEALPVNMGYDGENATLTLREIENNETVSKTYECVTFIPDDCGCTPQYFEAPVQFTEFSNAGRINSASDICSICINMEHTWIGDIYITLVCPTGQESIIKFGNPSNCSPNGLPATSSENGGYHGSNINLGWPTHQDGSRCPNYEPWGSPYGIGLDYCFSRNNAYTLVTGQTAGSVWSPTNIHPAGDFYICTPANTDNTIYTNDAEYGLDVFLGAGATQLPHCPDYIDAAGLAHPFPAGDYSVDGSTARRPSKHVDKEDYYLPYSDFSELVGCPLNGTWKVRVYDTWGGDNGWIFNWSMDICGVSQDDDCKYTVGIDSLIWRPDPNPQYHDYDLGRYRGLVVEQATPVLSYISSPDTAGTFPINVLIYDEFGCVWDTNTRITTYWTPEPNLGPDTALCGVDRAILDATDRHTATENYTYLWTPYGQNTPTIETAEDAHGDIYYVASVTNTSGIGGSIKKCEARDTIRVSIRKQPLPNFTPEPFTFEGCDPLTITFNNQSIDASEHLWVFGDGVTSTLESPTHTYAEGTYTLKYYATSDEGCVDSIVSEGGVAVFPKPNASFNWNPVYPSVLNPVVTYVNTTTPHTNNTQYFWELQYDRNNPLSFETLTTRNATFDYSRYNEDVSGNYNVRLIAQTKNLAPSGNLIYCVDTAANNVLVINDFLQFPNVVTPNGDGINDRFVIQNLVDGLGYPINSLDIYNQWGARVYHRENIDSEDDFWDPADVPDGTYFYRFSARGYNGNIEHNGSIEVIH